MILVVDNNDERRKNTVTWLRVKGYMSNGIKYEVLSLYTKPYMTVYINPTVKEAQAISYSDDTVSLLICDRPSVKAPPFVKRIDTLITPHLSIMKAFDECFNHFGTDQLEIVGYACMKNGEFALGGELISLSRLEYLIVCLFMVNKNKKFKIYDCSAYFNFKNNHEQNFRKAIYRINSKCKKVYRKPLFIANDIYACMNPEIANWVSRPFVESKIETDKMSDVFVYHINKIY